MADATLKVSILAVDKASKTLDKTGKSFAKVGDIAAAVGATALAGFSLAAINAASDLEETQSKVNVVFGESADKINEFAESSAESLGQSKTAAMGAAASFAVFGKSAGITGDDLADFSTKFTTLASDLASFNNTSPEQAIEAIGAALRGEAEPIRAYGVMLDDATLKQKALELGIIQTTKQALTPQQKVLAAQKAIFEQTTDAQGDFARTSDGLANQQRILSAKFKDTQTQLGQFLLPYAKTAVTTFNSLLGKFTALEPATQKTVVQMTLLAGAAAISAPKIADLALGLRDLVKGMTATKAKGAAAGAAIAGLGAAVIAGSNSIGEMKGSLESTLEAFNKTGNGDALKEVNSEIDRLRAKQEDLRSADGLGDILTDLGESAGAAIMGWTDINDAMDDYQDKVAETARTHNAAFIRTARVLDMPIEKVRELADVAGVDLSQGISKSSAALIDYYNDSVKSKTVTEKQSDAQKELGEEFATSEDKVKAFRDQLDLLDKGFLDLDTARDRAKGAQDDFTESLKQNGKTLSGNTEKGRANKDALRNIADTAIDAAESVFKLVEPTKGVEAAQGRANQELETGRQRFINAAIAAGRTKRQAEKLATQYGLIPTVVETKAKFNKKDAEAALLSWYAMLQAGPATSASAVPGSQAYKNKQRQIDGVRANGGPVGAGKTYLVGERGPELFTATSNGMIIPNGGSRSVGTTVVVNVNGSALASKQEIARVVTDALRSSGARGLATA